MTQKKLSIEDVKWEFRELGGSGYQDLTGVTVDKNGRCSVDQNGTYRAKFDYNGKTWYSPNPVLVSGKDYDSTRMPYITGKQATELTGCRIICSNRIRMLIGIPLQNI